MNIREAILKAADWIEKNPHLYNFDRTRVPDCNTPGCMVGWIGHFMGYEPGTRCWQDGGAEQIVGVYWGIFCDRIKEFLDYRGVDNSYTVCPIAAVKGLRAYADKYHPAEPSKELKSGAEICRAIIAKPYKEKANV